MSRLKDEIIAKIVPKVKVVGLPALSMIFCIKCEAKTEKRNKFKGIKAI